MADLHAVLGNGLALVHGEEWIDRELPVRPVAIDLGVEWHLGSFLSGKSALAEAT